MQKLLELGSKIGTDSSPVSDFCSDSPICSSRALSCSHIGEPVPQTQLVNSNRIDNSLAVENSLTVNLMPIDQHLAIKI